MISSSRLSDSVFLDTPACPILPFANASCSPKRSGWAANEYSMSFSPDIVSSSTSFSSLKFSSVVLVVVLWFSQSSLHPSGSLISSLSLQLPLEKTAEALSRLGDETDVLRGVTWWLFLLLDGPLPLLLCCCLSDAPSFELILLPLWVCEEPDTQSVDEESFGCTGMFINWHNGLVDMWGMAAAFTISDVLTGKEPGTTEGSSRQLCRPQSPVTGEITLADVPGLVALSGPLPPTARVAVMLLREISIAILSFNSLICVTYWFCTVNSWLIYQCWSRQRWKNVGGRTWNLNISVSISVLR